MIVSKVISAVMNGARTMKVLCFGKTDVRTPQEGMPYGYDGNPVADMLAIYGETITNGQDVIVGYINKNQLAQPGEVRIVWADSRGGEIGRIWGHNDGSVEIAGTGAAGSNVHHATQWEALNTELQDQINQINSNLTLIATAINAIVPASYTPVPIVEDFTLSKITDIKVP